MPLKASAFLEKTVVVMEMMIQERMAVKYLCMFQTL
jgi:hypothetical protein